MEIQEVRSRPAPEQFLNKEIRSFLLIIRKGSPQTDAALEAVKMALRNT